MENKFQQIVEDETHIIMGDTMAIFPWYTSNAELHSTVLEQYRVKNVPKSPLRIIEESLDYFGTDFSGRNRSASNILKGQRMLPVIISELHKSCMVPLCSPMKPDCVWLSFKHVLDIIPKGKRSIVILSNYQKIELDITRDALNTKLNNAARLLTTYDIRHDQMNDLYKMNMIAEKASLYNLSDHPFKQ